ncbi:hypothetical protein HZS_1433 [Henneguya salminicola]|uniref:RNA polymerase II subunit A C-terminal domain phosphatase SSU72 n=1 Tax=Henneguya salminicola TaxID=69463 RepID=A0A6G3MKX5_HENSL|nr:hypothetical protein HZS_1433 [Henneguya salminicola]
MNNNYFKLIITLEDHIFDSVIDCMGYYIYLDFYYKEPIDNEMTVIININIKDNQDDAKMGAVYILKICEEILKLTDIEEEIEPKIVELEFNFHKHLAFVMLTY